METVGGPPARGRSRSLRILASEAPGQHSRLRRSLKHSPAPAQAKPGSAIPENGGPSPAAVELAFFGHAFEGLAHAFDTVLVLVAIRWKQFDDPIGTVSSHLTDRARREVHSLTDLELVLLHR